MILGYQYYLGISIRFGDINVSFGPLETSASNEYGGGDPAKIWPKSLTWPFCVYVCSKMAFVASDWTVFPGQAMYRLLA